MAYQKLQSREALLVIPDRSVRIPDPTSVIALVSTTVDATDGVTVFEVDASAGSVLTGTNTKFTEMNIPVGAIVYNYSAPTQECYYVLSVDSDTQITVNKPVAGGASDNITIYTRPTNGCTLFAGGAGNLNVRMAEQNGNTTLANAPANQFVVFEGVAAGSFLPIQVIQISPVRTTATQIIAMW